MPNATPNHRFAFINVPLELDLATDFRRDLTIATRNGSKRIRTFAGDDTIHRGVSDPDCAIDGGLGTNTVVYPGRQADWTIARYGNVITVRPATGAGGTDSLTRIQKARFDDRTADLTALPQTPVASAVVEYYHSGFAHYFITASADEIAKLDAGVFAGWSRTGKGFAVFPLNAAGAANVCRFFSTSFAPKSSHFYTPFADECATVKGNRDWQFEADVFAMKVPDAKGDCPSDSTRLYRLYNGGQSGAPNHRYTTDATVRSQMLAQGFVAEGFGTLGVIGCVPA